MSPVLGQGQSVTQAVVTPQESFDHGKAPMVVSLFKPDGTPFLADTAAVYSIFVLVWNPLDEDAIVALVDTPGESPYPFKVALFNQTDTELNGLYQGMFGAPGTTGPQKVVKLANLPTGEAVFTSPSMIAAADRDLDTELAPADLAPESGGFVVSSMLDWVDGAPAYRWQIITDGGLIESRLAALEAV